MGGRVGGGVLMRLLLALLALPVIAGAQADRIEARPGGIAAGPGWEAFPGLLYLGGHSAMPKEMGGLILVLTDSTLSVYKCRLGGCAVRPDMDPWLGAPLFETRLDRIVTSTAETRVREAGLGSRILVGVLAGDRKEETYTVTFDTETTAETPSFRTAITGAAAIDAKVRFRRRKMGKPLAPADTVP